MRKSSLYLIIKGAYHFIISLGCQIYGFNASVAALAEIWSLAAVSYDRLIAINHPLQTGKRITKSRVRHTLCSYVNTVNTHNVNI